MESMTLEQLGATTSDGGIIGITLKDQGCGFFVEIATRSGKSAFLVKARSTEPHRFGNPTSALNVLRNIGIVVAQIDITNWDPDQKDVTRSRQNRDETMRSAHEAAAYNEWRPMACEDLHKIVRYIAKDNLVRAKSFAQELRDKVQQFAEQAVLGKHGRPGRPEFLRE